ncbi:MAG: hypothetical protein LDL24_06370 [Treponema sp.]|nr:hypothetical protein [Treponema sp.]
MFFYALCANVPFILIQRYNRARLLGLPILAPDPETRKLKLTR